MKRYKVCHLTSAHPAKDIRIFHKECSSLAASGYKVTLLVADGTNETSNGVEIISVPKATGGRISRMTKTVWYIYKKAVEINADIYHFHDPELLTIALLLKRNGKTVIYDSHEDVPQQIMGKHYINKVFKFIISTIFSLFENFIAHRLSAVISATPHINKKFLKLNKHSVDINNYPMLTEFEGTEVAWGNKNNEICYVGSIAEIRGIFPLLESLKLTNATLLLAGKVWPSNLLDDVMTTSIWQKVNYNGIVARQQIKSLLSQAKVGMVTLLPTGNFLDSQPIKLYEYMGAGIPVVASNFAYWKELVEGNKVGICVDPASPKEIADAVNYLLSHPEEAEEMGKRGRKLVMEKYNWEREVPKLVALYSKLMLGE